LKGSLVAIIVPDEEVIVPYCKKNGIQGNSYAEYCRSDQLKEVIFKALINSGKDSKLKTFEQVRDITLSSNLFSVENDILTPTFKLKRPQAYKAYKDLIEKMLSKFD